MFPSPPPATRALILINIAVSLLQQLLPNLMAGLFALWPPHSGLFEPWQLITYPFLQAQWAHGGWADLLFYLFALFMFGSALERRWGGRRFVICYLLCALAAAMTQLAVHARAAGSRGSRGRSGASPAPPSILLQILDITARYLT